MREVPQAAVLPWHALLTHSLFVALITAGTITFTLFVNWYDTLSTTLLVTGYDWLALVMPGILTGLLALAVELALLRWRGLWPARPWAFYLRLILFCAGWMSFGQILGSFVMVAAQGVGVYMWAVGPFMTVFYTPMALPFSLIVGSGCAFLLRKHYGRNRPL